MRRAWVGLGFLALVVVGWRSLGGTRAPRVPDPLGARSAREAPESLLVPPALAAPREVAQEARMTPAEPDATASASEPTAGASLEVHVRWSRDGSDAEGIGLVLWPEDDALAELHARTAETDGRGLAGWSDLSPGPHQLRSARGTHDRLELEAGERRAVELQLSGGIDVLGQVVDADRNAVSGAEIWLEGTETGVLGGRVVAHSDGEGSFFVPALEPRHALCAFAPGYLPSKLRILGGGEPSSGPQILRLTLVVEHGGATLRGRVLDPEGRPLAGACVAVGLRNDVLTGTDSRRRRARVLWTDAAGSFEAAWVAPDPVRGDYPDLFVLAEGFALARCGSSEVEAALGSGLVVRMERGARLSGTLATPDGPLAGGIVTATPRLSEEVVVPFHLPFARSGDDGAYGLEHVPTGDVLLEARAGAPGAREARIVVDGEELRWDPVLGFGGSIRGRVVDSAGNGLADQTVLATHEAAGVLVTSDARGEFVFTPASGTDEWTLALLGSAGVIDQRDRVRLGAEVVLVAREPTGTVRGGFTDRAGLGGALPARAVLEASAGIPLRMESALDPHGAFSFGGLPRGRFRASIRAGDEVLTRGPWFDLGDGETVELDWLESEDPASIAVRCLPPGDAVFPALTGTLTELESSRSVGLEPCEGGLCAAGLLPGVYRLSVWGEGLALHQTEVTLEPGREARLTAQLKAGLVQQLTFVPPADLTVTRLRVVLRASSSERTLVRDLHVPPGGPLSVSIGLEPGDYTVEATAAEGVGASGALEVSDAPSAELRMELH